MSSGTEDVPPIQEPHETSFIEYCVQAWMPYLQQDINNIGLEGVQRMMIKMMREVEEEEYE